ncbi:hypothetical protein [Wolbachia endosymbiont of Ctenocephalides felis wCfeT]|uniref:hypothetical protein n=1 Tax=Wolbachia endosymbiont of Ctenocephalides felis wCfeT TaxID=2732593 RepID=UPI0014454B09|nr:hypothetical protein [Wolbachia endosymbiont of Ctenocephalides felis wCfeT]
MKFDTKQNIQTHSTVNEETKAGKCSLYEKIVYNWYQSIYAIGIPLWVWPLIRIKSGVSIQPGGKIKSRQGMLKR